MNRYQFEASRRGYGTERAAVTPPCDCARLRAVLERIARESGEHHILRLVNETLDMKTTA
jgi:hypothetical protein